MMISIEELEQLAAPGWRGIEEERLGDWLLRAAGGFTGRANSGLPAMIAVPYPAGQPECSALDRLLAGRGWTLRSGPATVMIAASAEIASAEIAVTADCRAAVAIEPRPDDAWLARYHYRGQQLPS